MNVFHKVALQGLKKNRTRTFVTIIGVILSAAMITAVATFGISLLNYLTSSAIQKYGNWQAAFLDADSSFAEECKLKPEVAGTASFENIGYASLYGSNNPDKPYLFIAGFYQETFDTLPITLLSGRMPESSNEVIISGKIATDGGVSYALGDTLLLAVGNRMDGDKKLSQCVPYTSENETLVPRSEKNYTVVGICQTPVFEEDSSPGYTLITKADAGSKADSTSLFVTLENPRKVRSFTKSMAGDHAYILNHNVLRFMGLSEDPADKTVNALMYSAGGIVIAIIMVGSIFLIYNAFSISLNERMQQIGILASVGATSKQLRNSVLFEGLCIGAAGIPIGILAGTGSIWLVISVVAKRLGNVFHSDIPLTMDISLPAIAAAAAISIVTILISAYIPAKKAVKRPVMECIRQTNEIKVDSKAIRTSKLSRRIYGLEGILAQKNFKRNKKRYRSIILSLILSIVLFISTSTLVMDLNQMSGQSEVVTSYDIGFGTKEMADSEMLRLYDKLKTADGIYESSYQTVMKYSCTAKASVLSDDYWKSNGGRPLDETVSLPAEIQFLDDSTYLNLIKKLGLSVQEYSIQNERIIAVAKMQDTDEQVDEVSQLPNMFAVPSIDCTVTPGSMLPSETDVGTNIGQDLNLTFVDIVPPDTPPIIEKSEKQPYSFQIIAPWSLKEKLAFTESTADIKAKGMTFESNDPSKSAAEMNITIQGAGITSAYLLLNTSEVLEEVRNQIFIVNIFSYTFIIMISLIAVANVFNTISTNIKLRRQELAMLRSVGMSDKNFNKMMRFECAFYGMKALLIGLPMAVAASWFIHKTMVTGDIAFQPPWGSIGVSIFSVLLVIFVTMMYAVSKIKKENIIDALRDDMT